MIDLDGVTYCYPGNDTAVVADLHLQIPAGSVTAMVGPSGCGKSTLLYLAGLMLTPHTGRISLHGQRVDTLRDAERSRLRAQSIGFVFQDAMLDPRRSVLGNVIEGALFAGIPPPQATRYAHELLEHVGMAPKAGSTVRDLSGGQAQRVALCRALVKDPPVLLADEPTGNLDATSGSQVVERLLERAHLHEAAVLVVTHDEELARRCDRILRWEGRGVRAHAAA